MSRRSLVRSILGLLVLVILWVNLRPITALDVGTGFAARIACGLVFHTGLDPDRAIRDYIAHQIGPLSFLLRVRISAEEGAVDAAASGFRQARAIRRPGAGCVLVRGVAEKTLRAGSDPPRAAPLSNALPWPRGNAPLAAPPPAELADALENAFMEPENESGRMRQTLAVLVAHRGRLVAERYAPGIQPTTPLLSWSAAKSVTAALVGVASREGWLELREPAPVPEWREPGDPRGRITVDQLLRMSSGLAFDEHYGAINDVSRMLFIEPDAGAFAARFPILHEPDTAWSYSSGTSNILARILRDHFDRDLGAMIRWSRESLFDPLGMRGVIFETDASGSFVGSSLLWATGRDWLRFGQLFLDAGVGPNGQRLLPEGFTQYAATATPMAPEGRYGAGWWTNAGDKADPDRRMWPSLPRDAYAARGMSGQFVVVVPSAKLVVVRLGLSQAEDEVLHGIEELVRTAIDVLAAR